MKTKFDLKQPQRIFVLGSGGFGTALAILLASKGYHVTLWGRSVKLMRAIAKTRVNQVHLPGVKLPHMIACTSDLRRVRDGYDLLLMAVPTQHVRGVLKKLAPHFPPTLPVLSLAKGIEIKTHLRPSQVIRAVLGARMPVGVLSGPSHAEEIACGVPTSVVIASHEEAFAKYLQQLFHTPAFRLYSNADILGVELGGALKNIIAIAAGINDGMGLGDNAKSALMTRGLAEMTRLGVAMGAGKHTFYGLAGVGDLITTCVSRYGRNRACGEAIGRGMTLKQYLASTRAVTEGVWTARAVRALARRYKVEMPITLELNKILFQGKDLKCALRDLMTRTHKGEDEAMAG